MPLMASRRYHSHNTIYAAYAESLTMTPQPRKHTCCVQANSVQMNQHHDDDLGHHCKGNQLLRASPLHRNRQHTQQHLPASPNKSINEHPQQHPDQHPPQQPGPVFTSKSLCSFQLRGQEATRGDTTVPINRPCFNNGLGLSASLLIPSDSFTNGSKP